MRGEAAIIRLSVPNFLHASSTITYPDDRLLFATVCCPGCFATVLDSRLASDGRAPHFMKISIPVNGPLFSSLDCALLEVHVSIGQLYFASMLSCCPVIDARPRLRYWTHVSERVGNQGLRTLRA